MTDDRPTPDHSEDYKRLLESVGATRDGANWALLASDPMHDYQTEVVGFPDGDGRSIVYDVRSELSVARSANLAAAPWDCHVAFIPDIRFGDYEPYGGSQGGLRAAFGTVPTQVNLYQRWANHANTTLPPGSVVVWQTQANVDSFDPLASGIATGVETFSFDDYYSQTASTRVIAGGIEVNNTTPAISAGGSVTAYRFRAHNNDSYGRALNSAGTTAANNNMSRRQGPPTNVAAAKLLGGITWKASEGCYMPLVVHTAEMQPRRPENKLGVISLTSTDAGGNFNSYLPVESYLVDHTNGSHCPPHVDLPIDPCGCMFSGLPSDTTMVITIRLLIEVFPEPTSSLSALARPSPTFDPKALQVYEESLSVLHPGYPAAWNHSGDTFGSIYNFVKRTLVPGMRRVGHYVPAVGQAANVVDDVLQVLPTPKRRKAKTKKVGTNGGAGLMFNPKSHSATGAKRRK